MKTITTTITITTTETPTGAPVTTITTNTWGNDEASQSSWTNGTTEITYTDGDDLKHLLNKLFGIKGGK